MIKRALFECQQPRLRFLDDLYFDPIHQRNTSAAQPFDVLRKSP